MYRSLLAVLMILAAPAYCATLRVERDGSTGYTTIQAAVNAAASGDTIRIGPGRFDEGAIVTTPGWTDYVRVLVRQETLTFIGAGDAATIIGSVTPWTLAAGDNGGIWGGDHFGNHHLSVAGIGFENLGRAVFAADHLESMTIAQCRFTGNACSVLLNGGSLDITECTFASLPRNDRHVEALGQTSVRIADSAFNLAANHPWHQGALRINGVPEAVISGCSFSGGFSGLELDMVNDAVIANCTFDNQTATDPQYASALWIAGSNVHLSDSAFSRQSCAIQASYESNVEVLRTRVADVTRASIDFDSFASLVVHDCVLAKGARYTVWQRFPCDAEGAAKTLPRLDMTNNDWGTTSADSIASWIRSCEYEVDYIPFVGQPVSSEATSWGDLKASFR